METPQFVEDANGNRCYVIYFGSLEAAQKALDSLKDCRKCVNCSDCSHCSRCSHCSGRSEKTGLEPGGSVEPLRTPKIENIHVKMYESVCAPGALAMGDWHTCEKTHCRAGWIVTLAGEDGRKLERFYNTELAAMLIYRESTGERINPARFYDENDAALEDMRRLAETAKS